MEVRCVLSAVKGLIFCFRPGQGSSISLSRVDDGNVWKNEQLPDDAIYGLLMAILARRSARPVKE